MNYVYSPSENLFYAKDWSDDYGDSYPSDAIDVDESVFIEYTSAAPVGKVRVAGKKGMPQWADEPPLTHEQHVAIAESQKQALIAEASEKTE
ncbi:tail fiber assembly protein, partial [Morganella morganii]|uniref:tail fiber assembly protein n=1 Tax=Morganella morganii TaxID=582 RepID=UPI002368AE79